MGSWFACNVNQHGNLRLFWPWSVLLPLLGKPLLVLPRPALLSSRCNSRVNCFHRNRYLNLLAWVVCSFFEKNAFSRSQDLLEEQTAWYPSLRAEGWELGTASPELGPATTRGAWVHPYSFTHHNALHLLHSLGTTGFLKIRICLSSLKHQSLASYRHFINSAC